MKRGWGTKLTFKASKDNPPLYSEGDLGVMKLNRDIL